MGKVLDFLGALFLLAMLAFGGLAGMGYLNQLAVTVDQTEDLEPVIKYSKEEERCVARAAYGEARNQSIEGQRMVAWTVVFRSRDNRPYYGFRDLCSVAYHKTLKKDGTIRWQYDGANFAFCDEALEDRPPGVDPTKRCYRRDWLAWARAERVASEVVRGEDEPTGELAEVRFFLNEEIAGEDGGAWHASSTEKVAKIDQHWFGKPKYRLQPKQQPPQSVPLPLPRPEQPTS